MRPRCTGGRGASRPTDGGVDVSERVIVVGAGLVGLTCAVAVAEAGRQVDVLARDLPGETASSLGPSCWLPPPPRLGADAARWALTTRTTLEAMAGSEPPGAGVRLLRGHLVGGSAAGSPATDEAGDLALSDLEVPVISPVPYLRALTRRLLAAGGTLTRMSLPTLPTAPGPVVNCTGVASRALVPDRRVTPGVYRLLRVDAPAVRAWTAVTAADSGLRWRVLPDDASAVLAVALGPQEEGDDEALLARAAEHEPALAGRPITGRRTVVHADRDRVRLEAQQIEAQQIESEADHGAIGPGGGQVLHCYGVGSWAPSLSWGLAAEVIAALDRLATPDVRRL